VNRPDAVGSLLAAAVRLLPAGRRDWGAAMRAELAAIESGPARWAFAAGCVRVVATRPAVLRRAGYPLLMAGALAAALWWTSRIAYGPLHWGSVGVVVLLVVVTWLGRQRGPFGPVGEGRTARGLRAGGCLLIAVWTASLMSAMVDKDQFEQVHSVLPVFGVILTSYLVGFLTLTARRSAATARVLAAGIAGGVAAAVVWTVAVVLAPPIPADPAPAFTLTVLGMLGAALAAGRPGGGGRHLLAALCAGTLAVMLIVSVVVVLSTFAPPHFIPDLAPAALSPADDLAQSRNEIQDPYVVVLVLGSLVAALQSATALGSRLRLA
jgi:hypothetical protein